MLRFYFEVARTAFRRQLIYRWANIAGLVTNIFFGAIFSYVIIALYQSRPIVRNYDVLDTLRYTWLVQALIMVCTQFNWTDLMMTIRTGEVVSDLSKPYDFHLYWLSREFGRCCYYFLFRAVPIYCAGMVLFGIGLPGTSWPLFFWTLLWAAILGVTYRYLYNIVAFWFLEIRGLITLATVTSQFFTGSYVPLPLLPTWLADLCFWLPFYGLMHLPTEAILGKIQPSSFWLQLGLQLFWVTLFIMFARWLTKRAATRVVVQGG